MKKILGEKRFGTSIFNCIMINIAKEEMCTSRLFYKTWNKLSLEIYNMGEYTCHAGKLKTLNQRQSDSDTLLKIIHWTNWKGVFLINVVSNLSFTFMWSEKLWFIWRSIYLSGVMSTTPSVVHGIFLVWKQEDIVVKPCDLLLSAPTSGST